MLYMVGILGSPLDLTKKYCNTIHSSSHETITIQAMMCEPQIHLPDQTIILVYREHKTSPLEIAEQGIIYH